MVWWDPKTLRLAVEPNLGLRSEQILADEKRGASGEGERQGLERHESWRERREHAVEAGKKPHFEVVTPTEIRQPPPEEVEPVTIERVPREGHRPAGARFGTLVHTVLRDVDFQAGSQPEGREATTALAELHGRLLDATPEEVQAAAQCVTSALEHPLLRRAAKADAHHRETPVMLRLDDRRLVEGTLDLAFREGETWTVVDFKTDFDLDAQADTYRRQVAWYVYALSQLTGQPARGVLLAV